MPAACWPGSGRRRASSSLPAAPVQSSELPARVPPEAQALVAYDPTLLSYVSPPSSSKVELTADTTREQGGGAEVSVAASSSSTSSNTTNVPFAVLAAEVFPKLVESEEAMLRVLENQRDAYAAFSADEVSVMPIQTVGQAPFGPLLGGEQAQCCVKTGYVHNSKCFVIKVASVMSSLLTFIFQLNSSL